MISSQDLKAICQAADLDHARSTPTDTGHYNDSYYLDCAGRKYALRIAPADSIPKLFYEIDMMHSEPKIHRLVRANTDIPVPEIIHYDFNREIIDRDYLIMTFLPGQPGALDEAQLGRYVRQLHQIQAEQYGYPERKAPTGKAWPDIFAIYVELIFKDCLSCDVINEQECRDFLAVYEQYADVIENTPACLLHLDLWTQNILTENSHITGILDFDRGLYGDPELEFAVLDTYGYSTPRFFQGYGQPRPIGRRAQIRQKLYIVYELIRYAFIRTARNGNLALGRSFVRDCRRILHGI